MTAILDLLGSMTIMTMMISVIFQMHFYMYEISFETNESYHLQGISETVRVIIRGDVKQVGMNISDKTNILLLAKQDQIRFKVDKSNNNVKNIETFEMIFRDYPTLSDPSTNPFDKDLVYIDNGGATQSYGIIGLTDFELLYYDKNMNKISYSDLLNQSDRDNVRFINFKYKLLSKEPMVYNGDVNDRKLYPLTIAEELVYLKTFFQ